MRFPEQSHTGADLRPFLKSGCPDLNRGPLVPQTSALTRLRHTPSKGQSTRRSAELLVEPVDHVRQALELLGDDAHPELEEVLRLHAERLRERLDDVVRGHGPVPV